MASELYATDDILIPAILESSDYEKSLFNLRQEINERLEVIEKHLKTTDDITIKYVLTMTKIPMKLQLKQVEIMLFKSQKNGIDRYKNY